jgi:hypothetical protein
MFEFILGEIFHKAIKGGVMKRISKLALKGLKSVVGKTGSALPWSRTAVLAAAVKNALGHASSNSTPHAI